MAVIDWGMWTPELPPPAAEFLSMGISGKLRARLHDFQLTTRLDASQRLPSSQSVCHLLAPNCPICQASAGLLGLLGAYVSAVEP